MNIYVISDIHGHNSEFQRLLKKISLKKSDKLILLGDLIDRGKESKEVLDTILLLLEHKFDVVCLMGNHEKLFLDSFDDFDSKMSWLKNGGKDTLNSFLTSDINTIPKKYIDLIESFKMHYEIENYILVHAGINMLIENPFSDTQSLLWLRKWQDKFSAEWLGNRIVVHGHTPLSTEMIQEQLTSKTAVINIDNGCFMNQEGYGRLGALNLRNLTYEFIIK